MSEINAKKPLIVYELLKLLRPKQWTKNVLVFAALVFSKNLFNLELILKNILGFVLLCLAASCVYIINDTVDREKDRQHPKKCKRPIASGTISVPQAMLTLAVLMAVSFGGAAYLDMRFFLVILAYFIMNIAYSFYLKNIPIVDMMCIALGFVLRALAGGALISSEVSPWLVVCTFLLALFLAIHKRKTEIQKIANGSISSRKVLQFYTAEMLRDMSSAIDSSTIMAYSLYTFSSGNGNSFLLMCTIPFVIYGLFRYQYIIHSSDLAETPEMALLKDKPLLVDILLWGIVCIFALYI